MVGLVGTSVKKTSCTKLSARRLHPLIFHNLAGNILKKRAKTGMSQFCEKGKVDSVVEKLHIISGVEPLSIPGSLFS